MIIKNVPLSTIERIAKRTGVVLYEVRDKSTKRAPAFQFRLVPTPQSKRFDHYVRTSTSYNGSTRRVHAVCWHGHAVFMARLFSDRPDAIISSTFTTYTDAHNFFSRFNDTDRDTSHGALSIVRPASTYKTACLCDSADQYSVDIAIKDARADVEYLRTA